jgi:hypothetical protein
MVDAVDTQVTLSDAIEKGCYGLLTTGPTFEPNNDVWYAAYRGIYGRDPNPAEAREFYHRPPWGFGSDTEYLLRLSTVFGERWSQVIQRLKRAGL